MAEKLALSVAEAAKLLGVSVPTAYELARREDFPSLKIGRRLLVNRAGLQDWLDRQSGSAEGRA